MVAAFLHVDHLDLAVNLERTDQMDDLEQTESQELTLDHHPLYFLPNHARLVKLQFTGNQDQEDHQDLMERKESQELMVMADHVDHPDQKDHLDLTENQAQTESKDHLENQELSRKDLQFKDPPENQDPMESREHLESLELQANLAFLVHKEPLEMVDILANLESLEEMDRKDKEDRRVQMVLAIIVHLPEQHQDIKKKRNLKVSRKVCGSEGNIYKTSKTI